MTDGIHAALSALASGRMVVVADDRDREDEGDLVMDASVVTEEQMAFMLRWGSGIVCTPMTESRADALDLGLMVARNTDNHGTAFTVTVDHASTGTGISAADRAATVRALADLSAQPGDFRRPGHLFPLRARAGGALKRAGHTESAVDLLQLAGLGEVAVITELVDDAGTPLSGLGPEAFAREHDLPFLRIEDLVRHRRKQAALVTRTACAQLPLAGARFDVSCYSAATDGMEHLALSLGDVAAASARPEGVLVRVHSECLTGDVLGSQRCDCGQQLDQALRLIEDEGTGIVVYLRGHEGRGIGLSHKIRAYALQDEGHDTVDANTALGLPVDSREYGIGAAILTDLGVSRLRLITNNPRKYGGLDGFDLELVDRVRVPSPVTPHNISYLKTKRDRMGHDIDLPTAVAKA